MTEIEDLAKQIADLKSQVSTLTRTSGIANTSLTQGGETTNIADAVGFAQQIPDFLPGLEDLLAANEDAIAANAIAVQEATDAAAQAGEDGIAAGELASAAADDAMAAAQEALAAAAAAGGGATYSGAAPAVGTPGVEGQQWFVWDSGYNITDYYVYDVDTSAWVKTVITDAVLGNLDAGSITSGFLGADRIAAASLTAAVLAADTLTSREIGADAILARNIKALEITADKIAAATITGDKMVADTVTSREIKAGTITANEIAAGSITANEINLDSLNGKTITGATIRSAASGQRLEMLGTRIDVYSTLSTKAAGSIYGYADGTFSTITIANNYTTTPTTAAFTVPRNPNAGAATGAVALSRPCNLVLSHGIIAPTVHFGQLTVDGVDTPVIDATSGSVLMRSDSITWGYSTARTEVLGKGGPNRDQNRPRLTASELYYTYSGSPATVLPVMTASTDTSYTTPDVTITARDFQRRDGTSVVPSNNHIEFTRTQSVSTASATFITSWLVDTGNSSNTSIVTATGNALRLNKVGVYSVDIFLIIPTTTGNLQGRNFLQIQTGTTMDDTRLARVGNAGEDVIAASVSNVFNPTANGTYLRIATYQTSGSTQAMQLSARITLLG